jgi:lincosamide nucleotidyltransferase A/C/D/E
MKAALRGQGVIAGQPVRCMTPELQMRCKTGDFEPTEADRQDVESLHTRFGVPIPAMYRDRVRRRTPPSMPRAVRGSRVE